MAAGDSFVAEGVETIVNGMSKRPTSFAFPVGAACRDQLARSRAILLCGVVSQQAAPTRSGEASLINAVYSFDI